MFPEIDYDIDLDNEVEEPYVEEVIDTTIGRTPLYDFDKKEYVIKDGKIVECTQEEAVRQWVGFLIKTKADKFKVYDGTEFGTYIENYIGYKSNNLGFVVSEIERELTEKANQNRAIDYIDGFDFEEDNGALKINLTVHLISGEELEVEADV